MNRKSLSFQPQATELESRFLLSLTATPAPQTAEVSILSTKSATPSGVAVISAVKGRYFAAEDNRAADAPLHVELGGNGKIKGVGRSRLSGSLDLGGFLVTGSPDVNGTLTLSNARGAVLIRLTGSGGFSDVPNGRFVTNASVVKGTGAFRGFPRNGTVTFDFGANRVQSVKAPSPIGGSMTVTLNLKPRAK